MNNMIIGVGGAGGNVVKLASKSVALAGTDFYMIDSVTNKIDLDSINDLKYIPIIADEKEGSGRDRTRGRALYDFHDEEGDFDDLYDAATKAKMPVLVISSAAGGTGSGSIVPLCKALIELDVQVIPIIICPNMADPDAYHLNTTDLFIELAEVGVVTYSVFRNAKGSADYTSINNEIVDMIEIIFGKRFGKTDLDSIDDSDLDKILEVPGRFLAISAEATDVANLKKEIVRKTFSGWQPGWTEEESQNHTFVTALSLKSMFADTDYETIFEPISERIVHSYDEYKHIEKTSNNGKSEAILIVSGLPRPEIKEIDTDYKEAKGLEEGLTKSKRPRFMGRKKAHVTDEKSSDGTSTAKKFKWK